MVNLLGWLRQKTDDYLHLNRIYNKAFRHRSYRGKTDFHGTEYGGWTIIPEALSDSSVVYSFGIGEDASFDLEVIAHYGVEVHAFDPTPKSIRWVKNQTWPAQFHFYPLGIGASDRMATFYPPENPDHVSHTILPRNAALGQAIQVQLLRLKTIADMLDHDEITILKMDIEGAEYEVIDDLIKTSEIRVQQVLVEFHHFLPNVAPEDTQAAIHKLVAAGYEVFNISKRGFEYSLVRQ